MSIYRCFKCGCVDNTACSDYWFREGKEPLCTKCDTNKWHGIFPRMSAKGLILCSDGFLYSPEDVASDSFKFREKNQGLKVVREITEEGIL